MCCPASETTEVDSSRREALAALGEIASRMAHEIRNPLNAIRMQVAVIRNKLLKPDPRNLEVARAQLERLEVEVLRVEKLAKAFLEFGRPPADEPEEICLAALIKDVISLLEPEFEEAGHTLEFRDESAGGLWVRMDKGKLRQVLLNLLINAREAMSAAPGRACVQLRRDGDGQACIQIEDTGCGIPQEELGEIFMPFQKWNSSGEGLGLAIAHKIVDTAGGTIRVQSQVGAGSCFEVLLPLSEASLATQAEPRTQAF
ncbi:MAG TPA: ATP-binding protein [Phycisphaerae bacterium]|nr:ATP-binding protein [Phycisphaerae bacterium]HPU25322.1 ATP-binding protein [Phycisphaerae bacterium]